MASVYNVDDSINEFFSSSTTVTRQQCDEFVAAHFRTPAKAVPVQGVWSYTVTAGKNDSKIVQFREEASPLTQKKMQLVEQAATGFVAHVMYHGTIGEQRPLHIYEMNRLPGETYITAANHSIPQPADAKFRQRNTIQDLARFFAQSWNFHQQPTQDRTTLVTEYKVKLAQLVESLPSRFSQTLLALEPHISTLFSNLPYVVTHGDLCELNVLIQPTTGNITGIVDWAEVRVLPFGFALWGVENILGFMDSGGWQYYDNHDELRALFWDSFSKQAINYTEKHMKLVHIARLIGLFCRYGFITEGETILGVIGESETSRLAYLDAFCLNDGIHYEIAAEQ